MNSKKIWQALSFFPPIIIGLVVLKWSSSVHSQLPLQSKNTAEIVNVVEVKKIDITPSAVGYGHSRPIAIWTAVSQVSGTLEYVHPLLKKGEFIKKDTIVVRIDKKEYQITVDRLKANLEIIEAQIEELDVSILNNESLLVIENQSLEWEERELERQKKLMQEKVTATAAYEAQLRSSLVQKNRIQSIQNTLNLIPTKKKILLAQKKEIEAQIESAELKILYTEIKAPFSGIISEVNISANQFIPVGHIVMRMDDLSSMEIEAQFWKKLMYLFPKEKLEKINFKQFLYKNPDIFDSLNIEVIWRGTQKENHWEGEFLRFSGDMDPLTRSLGMVVKVKNNWNDLSSDDPKILLKGMYCEVKIKGNKQLRIVIPREAVHDEYVYIVGKENTLDKRKVEILFVAGDQVVLENGLDDGDKVILSKITPAVIGLRIKPVVMHAEEIKHD